MFYAVIDTNVLVSAMLKAESVPGKVALECLQGDIIPIINKEIEEEYRQVLRRPKFKFREDLINSLIQGLRQRASGWNTRG